MTIDLENLSSNQQVAVSMLLGFMVLWILVLVVYVSFELSAPVGRLAGFLPPALILTVAFIFLPLLYWRNRVGYIGVIILGIVTLIFLPVAIRDILAGAVPSELLLLVVPGMVISVILIISSAAARKEKT